MKQSPIKIQNPKVPKLIRKKNKSRVSFKFQISKVLKNIHPQLSFSKKSLQIVNQIIIDIFEKIMQEVKILIKINNKKTLGAREIFTAIKFIFPEDLARHAVHEGVQALIRYNGQ